MYWNLEDDFGETCEFCTGKWVLVSTAPDYYLNSKYNALEFNGLCGHGWSELENNWIYKLQYKYTKVVNRFSFTVLLFTIVKINLFQDPQNSKIKIKIAEYCHIICVISSL